MAGSLDDKLREILGIKPGEKTTRIAAIKQAFADAGYVPPLKMTDRGDGVKVSEPMMTDQEFYDRFLKEYLKVSPRGFHNGDKVKLAARRAAGLEND